MESKTSLPQGFAPLAASGGWRAISTGLLCLERRQAALQLLRKRPFTQGPQTNEHFCKLAVDRADPGCAESALWRKEKPLDESLEPLLCHCGIAQVCNAEPRACAWLLCVQSMNLSTLNARG